MPGPGKRQLVELRDTAEHLSLHHPLTDLPNRRVLRYELEKRLAATNKAGRACPAAVGSGRPTGLALST